MSGMNHRLVVVLALALVVATIAAQPARAFTMLDTAYGTPFEAGNPKAASMGSVGASLFQDSSSLIYNPAMLGWMSDRAIVEFNVGFTQLNEDRYQPLYDSFESYVTETVIASNRNAYALLQGGALFRLGQDRAMSLGIGIFDRFTYDYDYTEEIRDPSPFSSPAGRDEVVQLRKYEIEGRLRSVSAAYGVRVIRQLGLGLSIHRYYGTLDHAVNIDTPERSNPLDPQLLSDPGDADFKHDLAGWGWTLGLSGTVTDNLDLGVSFEGPFTVKGALTSRDSTVRVGKWFPYDQDEDILTDVSGDVELKYPGALSAGLALRPRNALTTIFSLDVVYRWWKEVYQDSYRAAAFTTPRTLRNTWDVRFGLEHVFYNRVPARFGFRYLENYADPESARSIFSGGLGYESGGFGVDISLQYHRQTTRQAYIFDRTLEWSDGTTSVAPEGRSKVEDGMVSLILGLSKRF